MLFITVSNGPHKWYIVHLSVSSKKEKKRKERDTKKDENRYGPPFFSKKERKKSATSRDSEAGTPVGAPINNETFVFGVARGAAVGV